MEPDPLPLLDAERTGAIPDPVGHPDAPDVVHQRGATAARSASASASPARPRPHRHQHGDAGRVPAEERRLQIGEVGHRGQRRVELVDGDGRAPAPARRSSTAAHGSSPISASHASPSRDRARRRPPGRRRDHAGGRAPRPPPATRPAVPTARRPGRPTRPARPSAPRRRPGRPGSPCRPSARRRARAHRHTALGQPEAGRQAGSRPRSAPTGCAAAMPGSASARTTRPARRCSGQVLGQVAHEEAHALARLGHQHRRHRRVERNVVAPGQHRGLRRVRRAAQEPQQRHVVHARPRRRIQPERLGRRQRQPARPQAVLHRLAGAEIRRQRQRDRQLRQPARRTVVSHATTLDHGRVPWARRKSRTARLNSSGASMLQT